MRLRRTILALMLCWSSLPAAQTAPPSTAAESPLPVRRVVLYKTGVGYFEHLGRVRDRQDVAIRFTSAQLNDVLKSLTTIDLGQGRIAGISYNSSAPLEQRLGALRLPIGSATTAFDLLGALRGARVEVTGDGAAVEGRLLSVERRTEPRKDAAATVESFSILTDAGEMRTFDLSPAVRVRIVDRDLRQEVGRYLDVVGSTREQDVRRMVISSAGTGERELFVSYISEVPIWKTTYRLVIPAKGQPLLQGWAIVDNTIGEDWTGVELSLVAGSPQSFVQEISRPYYGRRPVVPLPETAQSTPQTHQATLTAGEGRIAGRVRDTQGAAIPGALVSVTGPSGARQTTTDASGSYELTAPAGDYSGTIALPGFIPQRFRASLFAGGSVVQDATLQVGALQESVMVTAEAPKRAGALGGGIGGRPTPPPPAAAAPEPYEQMQTAAPHAQAAELGDLFEYRIKEPVTLRKNQSALVPIVNAPVSAEKVVLWNRASGIGRPLRALWIANSTGYTLDGGSVTVIDGNAFAGEGLVEPLKAGERRLVSYGTELGVLVSARREQAPNRVVLLRVAKGIVNHDVEERAAWTYTARNATDEPVTLVVEHRTPQGWKATADVPAAETTPDTQRYRVALDAGKEATLVVREGRVAQTSVTIGDLTDQFVSSGMRGGFFADDLRRALQPVIDKRVELAGIERRLEELESQQKSIAADQHRLRENMKALRGSREERELLRRYTRQLDEQENRLEMLGRDLAQAAAARAKAEAELGALIERVSFEGGGAP